ncbi:hypothetical protein PITC_087470 [Penicillium italicum]|uniref:Uncharacterized protein n=1 Tax=Penicillium italicum TaxID=40296 RepID=A0A0A2K8C4_PENIT|nr:hypothetical protein PITC_087470 [Penicillium italicum]
MTKTATPPTTPPMIAPRFEDAALGVLDGVLDGVVLAARTEDNAVTPVGSKAVDVPVFEETSEVVIVTGDVTVSETVGVSEPADVIGIIEAAVAVVDGSVDLDKVDIEETAVFLGTLGNKPMYPAVLNERVSSLPSSGQMPAAHGSLEQHPRKLPAEQTYHCVPPVQVSRSRERRDSRDLRDFISNTIPKDQISFTKSEDNSIKSQDTVLMLYSTSLNDWKREISSFQRNLRICQQE